MRYEHIQESVGYIRRHTDFQPEFGIILGSGLGGLVQELAPVATIPYGEIPHFPVATVEGHRGSLVFGEWAGRRIVAMAGRLHYYEGYSLAQVTFPVRVLHALGIRRLIVSNASGSVHAAIEAGDIVFIRDHINLMPDNPLRGPNDERLGPRFPDMLHAYDRKVNARALEIARTLGIRAAEGVYLGLQGPNLETPAEYLFAHRIGADLVGMSTVPEVIVARHAGLPVFAVSVATNKCFPIEEIQETTHADVLEAGKIAESRVSQILKELLQEIDLF
ncbi:MAG: hypothetical protein RL181_654 [Bacteroidota bacterium]|jgi:purine-nucleoside phosphorylase